ncbi:hypothetical protein [Sinomonas sp. ASV322]|uniref:hypothetical protein n=1 Tax=Sinomonas sp. ASV322 TaxID=3041920 RepID=UPI0027DDEB57|nr:hypothetical protein [Sinomonas sp. ASV322]MDQ4503485.1 hypothetical protein [Sinomonas sp. ASV322]
MTIPESSELLPAAPLLLTTEEVRLLWAFVHGDIMNAAMRAWLRASLGFCPRHTWAYAVVEIELWEAGVGGRGGHQPFDVSVLYEYLARDFARRLALPHGWGRRPETVLVPSRRCYLCTQLEVPLKDGFALGYANSDSASLAAEANLLLHTRRWCEATADEWSDRACPACLGVPGEALLCRAHLAERVRSGEADDGDLTASSRLLTSLADRLAILSTSMTASGQPADTETEASWIETLGFFAGWRFPAFLAGLGGPAG